MGFGTVVTSAQSVDIGESKLLAWQCIVSSAKVDAFAALGRLGVELVDLVEFVFGNTRGQRGLACGSVPSC